jgi:hypothetical protein
MCQVQILGNSPQIGEMVMNPGEKNIVGIPMAWDGWP